MKKYIFIFIFACGIMPHITKEKISLFAASELCAQGEFEWVETMPGNPDIGGYWEFGPDENGKNDPLDPIPGNPGNFDIDDIDIPDPDWPSDWDYGDYDDYDDYDGNNGNHDEGRDDGRDDFDDGYDPDDDRDDDRDGPDIPDPGGSDGPDEPQKKGRSHLLTSWWYPYFGTMPKGKGHCVYYCIAALEGHSNPRKVRKEWEKYSKENDLKAEDKDGNPINAADYISEGVPFVYVFDFLRTYFEITLTTDSKNVMDALDNEKDCFTTIRNGEHAVVLVGYDEDAKEFYYWDPNDSDYYKRPFDGFGSIAIIENKK